MCPLPGPRDALRSEVKVTVEETWIARLWGGGKCNVVGTVQVQSVEGVDQLVGLVGRWVYRHDRWGSCTVPEGGQVDKTVVEIPAIRVYGDRGGGTGQDWLEDAGCVKVKDGEVPWCWIKEGREPDLVCGCVVFFGVTGDPDSGFEGEGGGAVGDYTDRRGGAEDGVEFGGVGDEGCFAGGVQE